MTSSELEELLRRDAPNGYFDGDNPVYYKVLTFTKGTGISVFRHYDKTLSFKPALFNNGEPADVCMFRFSLDRPLNTDCQKVHIFVDVGVHNEWESNRACRYDKRYGYISRINGAPTNESKQRSMKSPRPLLQEFNEKFFYDLTTSSLGNLKNKKIKGYELLDLVYEKHIKTLSLFSQVWQKMFGFKDMVLRTIHKGGDIILWVLKLWDIKPKLQHSEDMMRPRWNDFEIITDKKLVKPFGLGYEVSVKIMVSYCLILVILAVCLFKPFTFWLSYIVSGINPNVLPVIQGIALIVFVPSVLILSLIVWQYIFPIFLKALYLGLNRLWWCILTKFSTFALVIISLGILILLLNWLIK